jgi:hypothetical protein
MAAISREWFPEPTRADDTYLSRGEPITNWLKRSTIPGAMECRRFLNENLSNLPRGHQRILYQALHNRWHSAFFEVIVARTLQVLGAEMRSSLAARRAPESTSWPVSPPTRSASRPWLQSSMLAS